MVKPSDYEITIAIIMATLLFLLLASFIVALLFLYKKKRKVFVQEKQIMENQFKHELLRSQLETQEYSFNQISQELHDNIGQLLSTTKLLLGMAVMELENVPDTLKTAEQTVGKAIQDLRSLSKSLDKEWLHQFNLIENLEAEKERINAARKIKVNFISQYEKLPLEPEAQVMLFRVVQEALQNSIKHASPENINIEIKNTDRHFEVNIHDDGNGFDFESAKKGSLGLRNMEHRTHLLGGTILWAQAKNKGTLITIRIPVNE